MKHYLLEPEYKKSVAEYDVFEKTIDGHTYRVVHEEVFRSGSWIIHVPETEEEINEWLKDRGEDREDYDSVDDMQFAPPTDEDFHELNDYPNHEFLEMWDGCSGDWYLQDPKGEVDEDRAEEIIDMVTELWDDGYHENLEANGWESVDCFQQIHCEVTLTECDDSGYVFDEDGV